MKKGWIYGYKPFIYHRLEAFSFVLVLYCASTMLKLVHIYYAAWVTDFQSLVYVWYVYSGCLPRSSYGIHGSVSPTTAYLVVA